MRWVLVMTLLCFQILQAEQYSSEKLLEAMKKYSQNTVKAMQVYQHSTQEHMQQYYKQLQSKIGSTWGKKNVKLSNKTAFTQYENNFYARESIDFKNVNHLLILGLSLFSILLFFGGFIKKNNLSVISGLLIFIIAVIMLLINLSDIGNQSPAFFVMAIGFYFMSSGNYYYFK